MIAETSLQAYRSVRKLGDKQQQVYNAIGELGVATNEAIAEHLGWPINRITGRVCELHSFGVVGVEHITVSASGRKCKAWGIRDMNDKKLKEWANDCAD